MPDFVYPSNAELMEVEQDLIPRLQQSREIFTIMPTEMVDDDLILWEQEDNWFGLQQVRGMNGEPGRVKKVGAKRWMIEPGYYGEFSDINEKELTRRRRIGTFGQPTDITDLVLHEQNRLLGRELDVQEYIGWTLLTSGTFSIANGAGTVVHTDTFSLQHFAAPVTWSTVASATPIADMRALKLLHRGHGVDFGRNAKLYMNQTTVNSALNNQNAEDLGGKRIAGMGSILSLDEANRVFIDNDLPMIVPMDEGYYDESRTFQLFIPNGKGVLVGKRKSGVPVASYAMTRNANNPDMAPGSYTKVVDNGDREVPRRIAVHRGHNGGPKIPFPASVVRCDF